MSANENMTAQEQLRHELCKVVDRMAKRHRDLGALEVCAALGIVAGTVTGISDHAEGSDAIVAGMLNMGFNEALRLSRAARAEQTA